MTKERVNNIATECLHKLRNRITNDAPSITYIVEAIEKALKEEKNISLSAYVIRALPSMDEFEREGEEEGMKIYKTIWQDTLEHKKFDTEAFNKGWWLGGYEMRKKVQRIIDGNV